ncbi:MAG: hypothetical protein Q9161_003561 [Pseudevernia consocians]
MGRGDTIARRALQCLDLFQKMLRKQREAPDCLPQLNLPEDAIMDAQAKFRTWVENIGALQRGKASLDDRLGHADIRAEILRLLSQLLLSLTDFWQIFSGARTQQVWTLSDDTYSFDFSEDEDSDKEDGENGLVAESSSCGSSGPTTESHILHYSTLEAITSLLKLSMVIRKSARGNKFARSSAGQKYETQYDIIHIRDRYPHASENTFLIERLGKANAQRRQWLSYKRRHRDKMAVTAYPDIEDPNTERMPYSEIDPSTNLQENVEEEALGSSIQSRERKHDVATVLSSTKASTFYQRNERRSQLSETDLSGTSYSESRFGDIGQETNLIPQPPPESIDDKPFECPYCFSIITITGTYSWAKHVHADLASYVCTQENCNHPLFESRKQWFSHELEEHRRQWVCITCDKPFPSVQQFEKHMNTQHSGTFLESQLPSLTGRAARPLQRIPASACPLCDYESIVRRKSVLEVTTEPITIKIQTFRNHLGRHLEQLALFVLPKREVVEQTDDTARSDAANEGEGMTSGQAPDSDDSEAIGSDTRAQKANTPSNLDFDGDQWAKQMMAGADSASTASTLVATTLDSSKNKSILATEDMQEDTDSTPGLAFVWMPPMDFTPPKECFEVDDDELIPRREEPMFGGDIYTPGWVRGYGKLREGFCGRCNPGVWHNIEDSSYEKNLTYMHGIASTGLSLPRPSSHRQLNGKLGAWHWVKEHGPPSIKHSPVHLHPQSAKTGRTNVNALRLTENIRRGDISSFKSTLTLQPRLAFTSDIFGRLPIHYAAELGEIDFMQYLLDIYSEHGTSQPFINARSAKGETALMLAVSQGNGEAAEWLMDNLADVNVTAANGFTALDDAAEAGYIKLAQLLLSHGASEEKAKVYQQIRLRNAALVQKCAADNKGILGPQNEEKTTVDSVGLASLHKAALQGSVDVINTALEQGVDIEEVSEDGRTPLMLAASRGHRKAIKTLVAAGANIDATSSKGWTTLMNAVRDKDAPTVGLLISNGADVNHLSPDRWTALAEAAYQSQTEIIEILLNCGADTESRSSHDWTPLMHASYKGDEAAVGLLLSAGADVDVTSQHDETALLLAAAGGHTRIVRTLLAAGCVPEPQWAKELKGKGKVKKANAVIEATIPRGPEERAHPQGWTPLMLACQGGHSEIAQILLDLNVDTEVQSPHGKTALEIAQENGRLGMAHILKRKNDRQGQ